jgi:hypothetical protein
MRNRSTVTAALALAAATILTIAACGSSVTGSAQPNQAAAASAESETSQTPETSARTTEDLSVPTELPTDLSDLTADLSALQSLLPSDLAIPSELTDLSIPSNLGLDSPCLTVALAYASVGLALLPALGGTGNFDATQLQSAVTSLAEEVPSELAGDVQALAEVAQEADGKSLIDVSTLLDSDKYTTATKHIEDWVSTNCGG